MDPKATTPRKTYARKIEQTQRDVNGSFGLREVWQRSGPGKPMFPVGTSKSRHGEG
jgi:hypothetical protein